MCNLNLMGLFRKTTSALTLGAVDFKSDKERTATYAKGARNEARKQTKIMQDMQKQSKPGPPPISESWAKIKEALRRGP